MLAFANFYREVYRSYKARQEPVLALGMIDDGDAAQETGISDVRHRQPSPRERGLRR